jgi:hypothetical protein
MSTEWGRAPSRDRTAVVADSGRVQLPSPRDGRTQTSRPWLYWLVGAALATVAYFFVPDRNQVFVYDLIGLSAVGAMFVGLRVSRPEPRSAWVLLAFGVMTMVGGDIAYGVYERIPSVADMLYVSGYLVLGIALIELVRRRAPDRERSALVDGAAIAAAVLVASLVFLGIAHSQNVGVVARAVSISDPLMDLLLFGLVMRLAVTSEGSRTCYWLLGTAFLFMMASDIGYMLQTLGAGYSGGGVLDAGWLLSYAFFGASLLHPSISAVRTGPVAGAQPQALSPYPSSASYQSYTPVTLRQALRIRRVLRSIGLMALGLGALALFVGVGWRASEVVLLGGMYGTTGSLMVIGSAMSPA